MVWRCSECCSQKSMCQTKYKILLCETKNSKRWQHIVCIECARGSRKPYECDEDYEGEE